MADHRAPSLLDRARTVVRDMVIVAAVALHAAAGSVLLVVVDAHGVTGVDWPAVGWRALDIGVVAAVPVAGALLGLPITRAYGAGSRGSPPA